MPVRPLSSVSRRRTQTIWPSDISGSMLSPAMRTAKSASSGAAEASMGSQSSPSRNWPVPAEAARV